MLSKQPQGSPRSKQHRMSFGKSSGQPLSSLKLKSNQPQALLVMGPARFSRAGLFARGGFVDAVPFWCGLQSKVCQRLQVG